MSDKFRLLLEGRTATAMVGSYCRGQGHAARHALQALKGIADSARRSGEVRA